MLYRVTGRNKQTNEPMVLQVEATNKTAADLKASAEGMNVTGVEVAEIQPPPAVYASDSVPRGQGPPDGSTPDAAGGTRKLVVLAVMLVALSLLAYYAMFGTLHKSIPPPPSDPTAAATDASE